MAFDRPPVTLMPPRLQIFSRGGSPCGAHPSGGACACTCTLLSRISYQIYS